MRLVEPEAEALRVGAVGLLEAGLVDQSEILEPVGALRRQVRMRRQRLEQVELPERVAGQAVPKQIVAAGPDQPHVASHDLVGCQVEAVVHPGEVIFVRGLKGPGLPVDQQGLVQRTGKELRRSAKRKGNGQ